MKKIHFLKDGHAMCGTSKTIQDTASEKWFLGMKHKCKTCEKLLKK